MIDFPSAYFKMLLLRIDDNGTTKSLLFSYDLDLGSNGYWNLENTFLVSHMTNNYWSGTLGYIPIYVYL